MLDSHLRERISACGLVVDEMEELFVDSGSVGPVLACIGEAESLNYFRALDAERAAAAQAAAEQRDSGSTDALESRVGTPGVGSRRWRRASGRSFSLSVRLDHDEVAELRRRAEGMGVGASVLARSYIRKGLGTCAVRLLD